MKDMNFGQALALLQAGYIVTRDGLNGWLKLQKPDANSKMTLPYICMKTYQGDLVPWSASQTDLLSNDWLHVIE